MTEALNVLIAEDEALIGNLIQSELEEIGHRVVGRALDGRQAVEMTGELHPDVVLMDIVMPEMDGLQAARIIQESCPTPVVLLTAYDDISLVEKAGEVGAGAYLVKPSTAADLARAIAFAVARFADQAALRQLNAELQKALDEVKTLQGILPICSNCRKVRDDEGYWQEVEVYIERHSAVEFSHGLCEHCSRELYPREYEALMRRKAQQNGAALPDPPPPQS